MATVSPEFQQRMSDLFTTTGMEFGMMAEKIRTDGAAVVDRLKSADYVEGDDE